MTTVVRTYSELLQDEKEILRYAGAKELPKEALAVLEECLLEIKGKLTYKACFCQLPIGFHEDFLDLTFAKTASKDLRKNLSGCSEIILLAATVGIETDRLISKYKSLSPLKALFFQSIGAERIEALCDVFCGELKEHYRIVKPRFSPGYGDLPLDMQRDIVKTLNAGKYIGLTLNESLLMSPSKSVTAIIGVGEKI